MLNQAPSQQIKDSVFFDIVELDQWLDIDPGSFDLDIFREYQKIIFKQYGHDGIPNGTHIQLNFKIAFQEAKSKELKKYFNLCHKTTKYQANPAGYVNIIFRW